MKRGAMGSMMLALAWGCGSGLQPQAPSVRPDPGGPGFAEGRPAMEGRGVTLALPRDDPGGPHKPTLLLHAEVYSVGEDNIWSLKDVRAEVCGAQEDAEPIILEAGRARFQETKMAYLNDGVVARVGSMRFELIDLEWINEERVGRTDHPVFIQTDDIRLNASSLRLYPDERRIVMTDVVGTLRFGRNES